MALSAMSMVSVSRISPTRMMSGSWRSAARSATLNPGVSMPISRWLIELFLFLCMNSIGSSMVRMWDRACGC